MGEVFVFAESKDNFIVMKQIAPSSCEMLTITNYGIQDVLTAYRYDLSDLVETLNGHMAATHIVATTPQSPLDVLRDYPESLLVKDIYDIDAIFSRALGKVVGPDFEYPEYSDRSIGSVITSLEKKQGIDVNLVESLSAAVDMASGKDSHLVVGASDAGRTFLGPVLGQTASHTVLSLGREAAIFENADLSRVPAPGERSVSIVWSGGKGAVSEFVGLAQGQDRDPGKSAGR
jgi:hypothetical protein